MNISNEDLKTIITEWDAVIKHMEETRSPGDKLYFFSASFGIVNRLMNLRYDRTLVFIHQGLQALHQSMQNRLNASRNAPNETHMAVPDGFIDQLATLLRLLSAALQKGAAQDVYAALEHAAELAYATTGNGYYLYLSGKLGI
jgi:hypothetical protein